MRRFGLLFALLFTACFDAPERPCAYVCGPGGACPAEYSCLDDGYCHLHGEASTCDYPDAAESSKPADLSSVDMAGHDLRGVDLSSTD